jgi:hypothetical protein
MDAASTAARERSGTYRNGTPDDATCTGKFPSARSHGCTPTAAATATLSVTMGPNVGIGCVIQAKRKAF